MLTWLVICRSTPRRSRRSHSHCVLPSLGPQPSPSPEPFPYLATSLSPYVRRSKSLRVNLFADPHPLTPVPSISYKKVVGRGPLRTFSRSDVQTCEGSQVLYNVQLRTDTAFCRFLAAIVHGQVL